MEPVLNELSVEPVEGLTADERMVGLVGALKALRALGTSRVLRSTADALNREVAAGRSIHDWLVSGREHREQKQFLRSSLAKAPFVEDLHTRAEDAAGRPVEVRHRDRLAKGLGAALLLRSAAVSLIGVTEFAATNLPVSVSMLDETGEVSSTDDHVPNVWNEESVGRERDRLTERVLNSVKDGVSAWERRADLFSHLEWSNEGAAHLRKLDHSDVVFADVMFSLVTLSRQAGAWSGGSFDPGLRFSVESQPTMDHPELARLRDCTLDTGEVIRLSLHLKLNYSAWRIYYEFREISAGDVRAARYGRAVVGYIGPHLPTSRS